MIGLPDFFATPYIVALQFSIIFGTLCAILATNKGHEGAMWWILGFLLGPLGLFLTCIQEKKDKPSRKTAEEGPSFSRFLSQYEPAGTLAQFISKLSHIGILDVSDFKDRIVWECPVSRGNLSKVDFANFIWIEKMGKSQELTNAQSYELWMTRLSNDFIEVSAAENIYFFER